MALPSRGPTPAATPGWSSIACRRRGTTARLLGLAVLLAFLVIAVQDHGSRTDRERDDAATAAHQVGLRLQSVLNTRLALTTGVAAYARTRGAELDQEEFEEFAAEIAASFERYRTGRGVDPTIRSLQIAPEGVVTLVWPLEGNEAAVGYDIVHDPVRGDAARLGIEHGRFVLAGPFELIQGGRGLIGRAPIYDGPPSAETFWGFATIVIDVDEVLRVAGIDGDVANGHRIAIRGVDGLGPDGAVFLGSEELFADGVATTINLPEPAWVLAAEPDDGALPFGIAPETAAIVLVGLAMAGIVTLLGRRWLDAQATARDASDHVAALLDSIDGPVISTDGAGHVIHWNGRAADLTGIPAATAHGRPLADVTDGFRLRRTDEAVADVAARTSEDHVSRTVEVVVRSDDSGTAREIDVAVAARSDGGVVLVGVDASSRRDHERLAADIAALEQMAHLKDQFVATTSHEMRTPLTSIIGLAELLGDGSFGELDAKQRKAVGTIGRAGDHLLAVVNQVLEMASITANGLDLEIEPVDVARIVEPVVEMVAPIADAKQVEMHLGLAEVGLVDADAARLGEVVLNLLSNAVKFTQPGGRVGVDVARVDDAVTISVWDTGVGVPADKQHLLFRPFVRIDNGTFTSGTGLGLSIAGEIVRLHGGTIEVASEPGRLTTFTVTLPVERTAVAA